MRSEPHDTVIIGSGPAGYTAAIYAARARLNPVLIEGSTSSGGALMNTTDVENFPGFGLGITGPELMAEMRKQAERFGATIVTDDVMSVRLSGELKTVEDSSGNAYAGKTVILAMGSRYRALGLSNEERLSGLGVSWCATCDGAFYGDQRVAVVGGGDSAMEEATFLTRFAERVYIIHRRDEPRASKAMQERLRQSKMNSSEHRGTRHRGRRRGQRPAVAVPRQGLDARCHRRLHRRRARASLRTGA